jgi:hypothetical protein
LEPVVGVGATPIPSTQPIEPPANRALAQEAALERSISYGDGTATITQRAAKQSSPQTSGVVRREGAVTSRAAGPPESVKPPKRIDASSTASAGYIKPDASQSLDEEAALRRFITY